MSRLRRRGSAWALPIVVFLLVAGGSMRGDPALTGSPYTRRVYTLPGNTVHSSVALGDLNGDGVDDIVVGSLNGMVSAYTGQGVRLWSYDTGDATIESKPAIGDIDRNGRNEVVVGIGGTFTANAAGGVVALTHDGKLLWRYVSGDFNRDGIADAVYSSPALADLDGNDGGKLEIVYGGYDAYIRALNHDGSVLWEYYNRDTIWSSPATGDLDRDGKLEVVIGCDSHDEPDRGLVAGGRLVVLNGEDGSSVPGFPIFVDETIWSSPALADITGNGWLDIVVGTGDCWTNPACAVPTGNVHPVSKVLYGWDHTGKPLPGWPIALTDAAIASPSVADVNGDGSPEVFVNTDDGRVHAFRANGTPLPGWPVLVTTPAGPGAVVHFPTYASPLLADLTGDGIAEVILPSNWEIVVFTLNGAQLTRNSFPSSKWDLSTEYTLNMTPAVGDVDGDGKVELVAGGARSGGGSGAIYIWDFEFNAEADAMPWRYARLDAHNRASFVPAPELAVLPASGSVLRFHEYGSGNTVSFPLEIGSTTSAEIMWEIETSDRVRVSSTSGAVGVEGKALLVTVDVSNLLVRSSPYPVGSLAISGSYSNEPVRNSPLSLNIQVLVVREKHQVFLPLMSRY